MPTGPDVTALPRGVAWPRALLFDWDNTLVDNWASIADALNATLEAMGHPRWTEAEVRLRVRASARDSFPKLFGERWEEAVAIFYGHFERGHTERLRALPGADRLVRGLAGAGFYLGVVSNKRGDYLRKEAIQLGWSEIFGRIVGATDAAADKPSADPINLALVGSGITPGPDVWYVGDAMIDIECAYNAGCTAILLGNGHGEMIDRPPHLQLTGCIALAKMLQVQ